ncbi:MAG TPA: outer membrane beta-barrel protein [Verrucomicrobiae bacterium]|nr:outer membrane beta-barrel protein [Verrucomicrobiae bacterium]
MTKWLGLLALILLGVAPTQAQDNKVPTWEVGGGYTFRDYNNPNTSDRFVMNGWAIMADRMVFRKWLSVAAQADGGYTSEGNNTRVYTVMAGPQVYPFGHRKITLYGQFLFGEGYTRYVVPASGGYPSTPFSSHAYAWQGGGGFDYAWKPHWTIRMVQFDYENTRFFNANPSQGNFKVSVGIMYRFGKLRRGR